MKKQVNVIRLGIVLLLFAAISFIFFPNQAGQISGMGMMNMNLSGEVTTELVPSNEPSNKLNLPSILEGVTNPDGEISYTITAQQGNTQLKEGAATQSYGYNGSILGPIIRLRTGQQVSIQTENELDTATSFHWHGLEVPSNVDGGPHSPIAPNQSVNLEFTVNQEAATLWFHPHPHGETAEQVYYGLAGLIYIEDDHSDSLAIPKEYGINDFPVIIQDRLFDENNQLNYSTAYSPDGTYGDTLVINGTINPYVDVKNEKIRLRLLNGSNARNYQFHLSDDTSFYQITSDGGFLNEPIPMESLQLVPGERAEIIVDLSSYTMGDTIQLMTGDVPVLTLNVTEETTEEDIPLPTTMNTITHTADEVSPDKKMTFSGMGNMVTIDGKQFDMDRIDLQAKVGETEVWEIENTRHMMGGMIHPFHLHGLQFKVLNRNGAIPPENERGWKDTIALYPGESVQIEVDFPEKGLFMYHCHLLEHEDTGMMGQILVE